MSDTKQPFPQQKANTTDQRVSSKAEDNIKYLCAAFNYTDDLKTKNINWGEKTGTIIYLETMVDTEYFQQNFLIPFSEVEETNEIHLVDFMGSPEFSKTKQLDSVLSDMLSGSCAIFIQGEPVCYLFNSVQANHRSPEEPENEKTVRGAHNGFVESIDINLNLIRERIHNRQLTIKYFYGGAETNTKIVMMYMNEIANPSTVNMVQERVEAISTDMIVSPGFIEESIEDVPFSPFQQVLTTERPDRVEANLIEGRIVIIADGSTNASIVPVTFFSFFQSPDDYNIRFYPSTFFRLLRIFSFLGALTLPAIYIAVVGFHFEIIPFAMVGIVKGSIENIPFSPLIEALVMAITIELVREAGIRLPTPIGQTIGIVGGLIIGDAVVNAGLVSNIMVIVIALTAIMSFSIPSYEMGNTVRILSLPIMFGAASLGFVGIIFAFMIILIHMCKLETFGTPYLSPLTPLHFQELKDAVIRVPNWLVNKRPRDLLTQKPIRERGSRKWDEHG